MISTSNLTKRYGKALALDALDLEVGAGELYGFIGPNGAGKTTTLQILATLLPPTSGVARVDGRDVREHGREVRRLIGYMPDFLGLYEALRVAEYLEFFAAAYDIPPKERTRVVGDVLALTDLSGKRTALVGELSRGMQQRLSLARVLIHDPKVLLLDEPASGLDPRARVELREILRELQAMGKTIILSSHVLSDLAEICSSVGVLSHGRLVASGPLHEVLAKAGAGEGVRVRLDSPLDGADEALRALDGVKEVSQTGPNELRILFGEVGGGPAATAGVAALLVSRGYRLSHLAAESVDLEEAYLRLTEGGA